MSDLNLEKIKSSQSYGLEGDEDYEYDYLEDNDLNNQIIAEEANNF